MTLCKSQLNANYSWVSDAIVQVGDAIKIKNSDKTSSDQDLYGIITEKSRIKFIGNKFYYRVQF